MGRYSGVGMGDHIIDVSCLLYPLIFGYYFGINQLIVDVFLWTCMQLFKREIRSKKCRSIIRFKRPRFIHHFIGMKNVYFSKPSRLNIGSEVLFFLQE